MHFSSIDDLKILNNRAKLNGGIYITYLCLARHLLLTPLYVGAFYIGSGHAFLINCKFANNTAEAGGGGGVYWLYNKNAVITYLHFNNSFRGNYAVYGNDYATDEAFLEYSPDGSYSLPINYYDGMTSSTTKIMLFIVDYYRQLVTTTNIIVDWSYNTESSSCVDGIDVCGMEDSTVSNGTISFDGFSYACNLYENIDLDFYSPSMKNVLHVGISYLCTRGQMYATTEKVCVTCTNDIYSLDQQDACKPCPSNAKFWKDVVWADPGYWKVFFVDDAVMECPYGSKACPGRSRFSL
jgi:hypothetical protein